VRIGASIVFCIAWGAFVVFLSRAMGDTVPKIPPAPTCTTIPADKPEYRDLLKACKKIIV
jgi:hypothetical protein